MAEFDRDVTDEERGVSRYWKRISYGAGRSVVLGVLTLLVLIASQVLIQRQSHDQKISALNQELDNGSRDIASRLGSTRDFLERLASALEARSLSEKAFRELTDQHIRANPEVVEIAYISRSGREQWNARGLPLPEVLSEKGPSSAESELYEILSRVLAKAPRQVLPPTPAPTPQEEALATVPQSEGSIEEKGRPPGAHLIQLSEVFGSPMLLALESTVERGDRVQGSFFAALDLKQLAHEALKPNLRDNFAVEFALSPGTPVASLEGYALVRPETPDGRSESREIFVSQTEHADRTYATARSFQLAGYNFNLTLSRLKEPGSGFASFLTATSVAFALALLWSILILVRDSTRSRELGVQLESARAEAEKASRAKSELIANVSHELRTPLGSIEGYTNLLEDQLRKQEAKGSWPELLAAIRRNTGNLFELVDELLDMSKLEAGLFQAEPTQVVLQRFLSDIVTVIAPAASSKQLHFSVRAKDSLPVSFIADQRRMRQILLNLLSNAVKFTESGSVELSVAHDAERKILIFNVGDSGPGISESFLPRLFAPFQQEDGSVSRRFGGTGLGLALSKKIANGLGAQLELTANGPSGAVFSFTVPVKKVSSQKQILDLSMSYETPKSSSTGSVERLDGVRVLIVEDCPDTQRIMASYLENVGAQVFLASTGRQALELLERRRLAQSPQPDAMLIDLQMPDWDGFRTMTELRKFGYQGVSYALSATAFHNVKERAIALGCSDFFLKPVDPGVLTKALSAALKGAQNNGAKRGFRSARQALEGLRPQFLAGLAKRLITIQNSLENRDPEGLSRAVHQLKGASQMYGFGDLARLTDELEGALGQEAVAWPRLREIFSRLRTTADSLREGAGLREGVSEKNRRELVSEERPEQQMQGAGPITARGEHDARTSR